MVEVLVKCCLMENRFVHIQQHVKRVSVGPGFPLTINSIKPNHEMVIKFKCVSSVSFSVHVDVYKGCSTM